MTRVILDANALISPFQFSINLDTEISRLFGSPEVYVPSSVIDELEGLERKDALKLANRYEIYSVENIRDEGVLEAAKELDGILMTNDSQLRERARSENIPVAYLRERSYYVVEGEI